VTRFEGLLREWGEHVIKHIDWADEYGENILYQAGLFEGSVQEGRSGSKVLCPEMPPRLRKVDLLVNRLPNRESKCVKAWYCAPPKEDGKLYTKRELARVMGISKYKFDEFLRRGKKRLLYLLTV